MYPLAPKLRTLKSSSIRVRLRVGLVLGLGLVFVYPLTTKLRTPKFEFQ